VSTPSTAPTPRRRSRGLTRERIVDAALAMVETDGVEQLSMRKLAAELDIVPTSIYWHVGGREELLDAVVERFTERLVAAEVRGRTPASRVLSIARQFRDFTREHPHLTVVANDRGLNATAFLPLQIALARELTAAGLRGRRASRAMRSIVYVVAGFIVLADKVPPAAPTRHRSEELWADVHAAGIDPGLVAELRQPADFDEVFEDTIRALVEAILPTPDRPTS
jgi:TetR/AcrR family transcriptional regulator, tetracycline repressor protein